MLRNSAISLILKIGLSLSSIMFAVLSIFRASDILSYYPNFLISLFGDLFVLILGACIALFLSIWIFSAKHKFAAVFTYAIALLLGIFTNISSLTFLAIAWPLFCMSLALSLRYYPRIRVIIPGKNGEEKMKIVPIAPPAEGDDTENDENSDAASKTENIKTAETKSASAGAEKIIDTEIAPTVPLSTQKTTNNHASEKSAADNTETLYGIEKPITEINGKDEDEHRYSPYGADRNVAFADDDLLEHVQSNGDEYLKTRDMAENKDAFDDEFSLEAKTSDEPVKLDPSVFSAIVNSSEEEFTPVSAPLEEYEFVDEPVTETELETLPITPGAQASLASNTDSADVKITKAKKVRAPRTSSTTRTPRASRTTTSTKKSLDLSTDTTKKTKLSTTAHKKSPAIKAPTKTRKHAINKGIDTDTKQSHADHPSTDTGSQILQD